MAEALGTTTSLLHSIKAAIDPHGILNPGKLGLPDPFGEVGW
jgi:alkyldihydroxyacetonephosphate synthase